MEAKVKNDLSITLGFQLLFLMLTLKIIFSIRKRIPSFLNCWFCNKYSWISYPLRNSWVCQNCEQYNGFTSDGDYNKQLDTNIAKKAWFNTSHRNLPTSNNGLCYKCNTNQQLKIMQLANFKPMIEKNFDNEVDAFKIHLEKVYHLCSNCKKYVKEKLQKEKGTFLGAKLVQSRILKKSSNDKLVQSVNFFKKLCLLSLKSIAIIVLIYGVTNLILNIDLYMSKRMIQITNRQMKNVYYHIKNTVRHIVHLLVPNDHILQLIQTYNFMLQEHFENFKTFCIKQINSNEEAYNKICSLGNKYTSEMVSIESISLIGFILQILLHISEFNVTLRYFINDIVWGLSLYISRTEDKYLNLLQILLAIIVIVYPTNSAEEKDCNVPKVSPISKKIKNLSDSSASNTILEDDDCISDDSDVEIMSNVGSNFYVSSPKYSQPKSQSQYGSQYYSNPSCYAPSMYSKNTMYGFNVGNNCFPGPMSPEGQRKFSNNRSELDQSIGELNLGKQNKKGGDGSFVFSTRQYNCSSPNIFMPSPTHQLRKPVLSPSRFIHGTQQSWVAGGYWGADSPRQLYNIHNTSRSSSQSSGFESLASSAYHKNINSFPPSREDSVSSDCNKKYENCFHSSGGGPYSSNSPRHSSAFQSFCPQNSPIFPNLRNNESVLIPNHVPYNNMRPFGQEKCSSNESLFKTNVQNSFVPVHNSLFNE